MADLINNNYKSINEISKQVFASMSTMDDKKFFLKLRKEYFIINNIKDYKERQAKLYGNKTRKEIIDFEIARIKKSEFYSSKIEEQIKCINELIKLFDNELTDEVYEKIIGLIIRIELSADMKIGLFEQLCRMFDNEVEKVTKGNSNDVLTLLLKK